MDTPKLTLLPPTGPASSSLLPSLSFLPYSGVRVFLFRGCSGLCWGGSPRPQAPGLSSGVFGRPLEKGLALGGALNVKFCLCVMSPMVL